MTNNSKEDGVKQLDVPDENLTKLPAKNKRAARLLDVERNPCAEEYEMSLKCSTEPDAKADADKCKEFFFNYRNCNNFWRAVTDDRRSKSIKPYLPAPSEREKVRQQYMHRWPSS